MDINEMIAKCYSREKSCEFYKDKRALFCRLINISNLWNGLRN